MTGPVDDGLFPAPPKPTVGPETSEQRIRRQQQELIGKGLHPLTKAPRAGIVALHPDAPTTRTDPGPRCGTCLHRTQYRYAKCTIGDRITRGLATDVRAWWPACRSYEEKGQK